MNSERIVCAWMICSFNGNRFAISGFEMDHWSEALHQVSHLTPARFRLGDHQSELKACTLIHSDNRALIKELLGLLALYWTILGVSPDLDHSRQLFLLLGHSLVPLRL